MRRVRRVIFVTFIDMAGQTYFVGGFLNSEGYVGG